MQCSLVSFWTRLFYLENTMKKENIGLGIAFLIIISASFYAGYNMSPTNKDYQEQKVRIRELEDVIVQQQLTYQYMLKSMPNMKIKNWAMNKH